jgi:hypothetical protein
MGYTHYFKFKIPKGIKIATLEAAYKKAVLDCAKVVVAYNAECVYSKERLSGYTAHTKPGSYGGIKINGKQDLADEDFVLREHFTENMSEDFWGFCKTARKPYDKAVVACLAILKYHLKDGIKVLSDGRGEDWSGGVQLARRVLNKAITNPIDTSIKYLSLRKKERKVA